MKVHFVTQNRHKVEEVKRILEPVGIEVEQINLGYDEPHDLTIHEIAKMSAKKLANELGKPIILEDTGIFFEAYNNFPGPITKVVFAGIGYEGIFRLLKDQNRKAYFMTVAGYCEPGKEPVLFEGKISGTIAEEVRNKEVDLMAYDMIFIPDGETRTISEMSNEEKDAISWRAKAFRKFAEYVDNHE